MKNLLKFIIISALFIIYSSSGICSDFDIDMFNSDRDQCYRVKDSVECFHNLMTKYFYIDPYYINYLHMDTAKAFVNNKRYKEALFEYDYVILKEKNDRKLIAKAKEEKQKVTELMQQINNAQNNDYGDYYNQEQSAQWRNPEDIKVYIKNNYGKGYILSQAFNIWQDSLNGLIKFNFVSNEQEANIVCHIVENVSNQVAGRTNYGVIKVIGNKNYLQKVFVNLSLSNGADNTDELMLTTALHEIGHALGIRYHSDNKNDIMYYEVHSYRLDTVSQRDINTIKRIYEEF